MARSPLKEKGGRKPLCGVLGKLFAEKSSKVALQGGGHSPSPAPSYLCVTCGLAKGVRYVTGAQDNAATPPGPWLSVASQGL